MMIARTRIAFGDDDTLVRTYTRREHPRFVFCLLNYAEYACYFTPQS